MSKKLFFRAFIAFAILPCSEVYAQSSITENPAQTLYAAPNGMDSNSGFSESAPKSLTGAISVARSSSSRVVLLDGHYRTKVLIPQGNTLLIIQAKNTGAAVITGSDLVANWTNLGNGIYSMPWVHNWGVASAVFSGTWTAYNLRREMVFINGARLLQRCDSSGNPVANSLLLTGEFTVSESADTIYFRPPANVTLSTSSQVEVAVRGSTPTTSGQSLLRAENRSNFVMRGLVFQHTICTTKNGNGVSIAGTGVESQILVEDCTIRQNNGIGMEISGVNYITLNRVNASVNGNRGAGFYWVRDALVQDCAFNENNWRTAPVNIGHDAAGFKLFDGQPTDSWFMRMSGNILFKRCNFLRNTSVGFWQDYGGTNVTLDACRFDNNEQGGIMQEMTIGPFTVNNCVVSNNGVFGILNYGSPNGKITNSSIYGTRTSTIAGSTDPQYCAEFMLVTDDRTNGSLGTGNNAYSRLDNWTILDNTIQATVAGIAIFYTNQYGSTNPHNPAKINFISTITSNRNRWWRRSASGLYTGEQAFYSLTNYSEHWKNSFTDFTFSQWKSQSKTYGYQDVNSTWGSVDLSAVADPTTGGTTPPPSEPTAPLTLNDGSTVIGTSGSYNNSGDTIDKVFDGNLSTFFDSAVPDGNWVGLSFGSSKVITGVSYAPSSGFSSRMVGAIIQGSNSADFSNAVVNLATVSSAPTEGVMTSQSISNSSSFLYARILLPANSWGNIAELKFTTTAPLLSQTITFAALDSKTMGSLAFNLAATASSGLTVTYTSNNTSVATVSGNTVTLVSAGSTSITASQSGNGTYAAATPVSQTLTLNPASNVIGTSGSLNNSGDTIEKVFDGNLTTFFDAPTADGNWVGQSFGSSKVLTEVRCAPRSGFTSRMVGSIIQGSNSATFSSGVVNLVTLDTLLPEGVMTSRLISNTTGFLYGRILLPSGSWGNIAELQFFTTTPTTSPNVTTGLSARLAFNEVSGTTAADSTGLGKNGTLQSGASFTLGKISNAVSLNGTSGYVVMPCVFNPAKQSNLTVTAWVRLAAASSNGNIILQQEDGRGTGRVWLFRNSAGQLASFLGNAETKSASVLSPGVWYHVALVKTGSSLQLYINGTASGSPASRTIESSVGKMRVGANKTLTNQFWNGSVDELRYYNRALSASEISTVANWSGL